MNIRTLIIPATVAAALAIPGVASANLNTVDATCEGLTFSMPRGEEGTVVEATVDGRRVAIGTVLRQFDPIGFTVPNPDLTVAHTWTVTIDSVWNADQRWSETVPACVAPTTTSTVPPSLTTPPTTAPAVVVVTTTTGVDVGPPPTPPVVTSPPVVTMPGRPTTLPDTGSSWSIALAALAATGIGAMFARLARRGVR